MAFLKCFARLKMLKQEKAHLSSELFLVSFTQKIYFLRYAFWPVMFTNH
jgi:hypothetical protein